MSHPLVHIRELAAWGFDTYQHRPATLDSVLACKADKIAQRTLCAQSHVLLEPQTEKMRDLFDSCMSRSDFSLRWPVCHGRSALSIYVNS